MKQNRLILVDGSGYIFRAFYALPPMTRADGTPVNAVFGFTSMLLKLSQDMEGENILVVFDAARTTFRNKIYKDYKANRSDPPEELVPQFSLIRDATEAIGLKSLEVAEYEADDIIATYVKFAVKQKIETVIISSDKDLMQLIQGGVSLYDPMKNIPIGADGVIEKFGVTPDKVIDVQALAGDTSDNVPGIPGIGIKTAAQLINEYGNLENLLENAQQIKQNKRRESLINHSELAKISKQLVSLFSDVPLPYSINDLKWTPRNDEKLLKFLRENNFKRLENKLFDNEEEQDAKVNIKNIKMNYKLITEIQDLDLLIQECQKIGEIAIDTETNSINAMEADLIGVSIATKPGIAYYIPLRHSSNNHQKSELNFGSEEIKEDCEINQINFETAIKLLKTLFEDSSVVKIGHNIKYDKLVLSQPRNGSITLNPIHDTMCMSYVIDANRYSHKLDSLVFDLFEHETIKFEDVCGKGSKQVTFDKIYPNDALNYAAEDADFCLRIYNFIKQDLFSLKLNTVYETIERPLINVIVDMEKEGILINKSVLNSLSIEFQEKLNNLQQKIFDCSDQEFNIGSPKQLGEVLFNKMNLPEEKKSKSGNHSTSISVLEALSHKGYKIADLIIEWRGLAKLKSTYTDALQESINKTSRRVHTSFSMASASTGRLASSNPNLQNIPIRSVDGKRIRESFISKSKHNLLSADYSQIELRLIAHAADEQEMIESFKNNTDIHAQTASKVFGIPIKELNPETRRRAKAINFGIIYGISAFGLSKQLSCSQSEAKNFIDSYFDQYPNIRNYMDKMITKAKSNGYVETFFGRRIPIRGINSKNFQERSFAERQSINAPIQGSAADIIKRAMIRINKIFREKSFKSKMLLQVHDELVFECPENELVEISNIIKTEMENAHLPSCNLQIPLIVDFGTGQNWAEAH